MITAIVTLNADFFAVKRFEVNGCNNLTPEQVISQSGIKIGQNILLIDKSKIVRDLEGNPWITSAKIITKFPSKVIIEIVENVPAAAIPYMGSFLIIDKQAALLNINEKNDAASLPVITGLQLEPPLVGQAVRIKSGSGVPVLKAILAAIDVNRMASEVSEINAKNPEDIIIYFLGGIEAKMGDTTQIASKLSKIPYILEDIRRNQRSGGYIDLKTGADPVYRKD